MKRQTFLKSFLGALGAVDIIWTDTQIDKIYGTVIYDLSDFDERQDFVWQMTEDNVPNENVKKLVDFLSTNNLIDIDKIIRPIEQLDINFIDKSELNNIWDELFEIEVKMLDDGQETDSYFLHD
jgi:hypothetical protein